MQGKEKKGSHQQCAGHLYSRQDPVKDPVNNPGGCHSLTSRIDLVEQVQGT